LAPVPGAMDGASAEPQSDLTLKSFRDSELKPCTIAGVLRGTLVSDNPELSVAVVVRNDTREPATYSIKEGSNMIADDAVLVAVRSREIVVRRRDHFERCDGEGELPGAPPVNTIVSTTVDNGASGANQEVTGVTKLSPTDYKVERAEVDRALSNLNEVATQARMVPSLKNGKPNGFKVFSIKPGSIYSKIGLQNGDVIQKINGYDLNSPDRALEIYTKLRDATTLSIELQRGGNTQTMNYAIN
jgi:general secretion pathway protein C